MSKNNGRRVGRQISSERSFAYCTGILGGINFVCLFLLLFLFSREIALQVAATAPLLSRPKRSVHTGHVYPHVFDALAETQRATAFISDTKVLHDSH